MEDKEREDEGFFKEWTRRESRRGRERSEEGKLKKMENKEY